MQLDLTDEEADALLRELNTIIENDRYHCRRVSGCCAKSARSCREPRPRRHRHDRRHLRNATASELRAKESDAAGEIQAGTTDDARERCRG
jgi:hypothetical protein